MRKIGKGGIINITSITTQKADPLLVVYGASKGAAEMLTRDLAAALRPYNITVIAVAPGTRTMNEAVLRDQERREMLMARTPLGRLSVEGADAAARRGHRHGGQHTGRGDRLRTLLLRAGMESPMKSPR